MALTATTLSAAITATQTTFTLASGTGIVVPNFTATPPGTFVGTVGYLLIEQELMQIQQVNGAVVTVQRGYNGTLAVPHGATAPVLSGFSQDFFAFVPAQKSDVPFGPNGSIAFSAPVASATTITASGQYFHITGTTAIATINLPNYVNLGGSYPGYYPENPIAGMQITVVFDGVCTWTAAGNISVAGTSTAGAATVIFTYDPNTSKWYPSRVA